MDEYKKYIYLYLFSLKTSYLFNVVKYISIIRFLYFDFVNFFLNDELIPQIKINNEVY